MGLYVGVITLRKNGKIYGATTRQYPAKSVADFRRKVKKKFAFKGNKVTVTEIKNISLKVKK